jgi:DNA recombination protein RmuC
MTLIIIIGAVALLLLFFNLLLLLKVAAETAQQNRRGGEIERAVRDEIASNRGELNRALGENRQELLNALKMFGDSQQRQLTLFSDRMRQFTEGVDGKFMSFQTMTAENQEKLRTVVDGNLKSMQESNVKKLDEMRQTVDEKLRESVEKRFNESFKLISERLDQVHKGLGEMQTLANGVGDLKKVLSNVKTRGNLGEIQLAAILEECLAPEQYETNVATRPGSAERVEFAVKMPGRNADSPVYLPIDSKFPVEDYQRLLEAYDNSPVLGPGEMEIRFKAFENAVRKNARDISEKYINPPGTTDFAIMFVPTEGLYAEILRRRGLFESLNRDLRIAVVGPANLVAFLNSLQMGFRTLAIEKRSSEVWTVLGAIKTEFGKFGDVLEKTRKKLEQAANEIDQAGVRSRAIHRKLRNIQELPAAESARLLDDIPDLEIDVVEAADEN